MLLQRALVLMYTSPGTAGPQHEAARHTRFCHSDLTSCMPPLQFQRELAAMTLLSQHKNVLPLLGACMQPDLAALVTPYCPR